MRPGSGTTSWSGSRSSRRMDSTIGIIRRAKTTRTRTSSECCSAIKCSCPSPMANSTSDRGSASTTANSTDAARSACCSRLWESESVMIASGLRVNDHTVLKSVRAVCPRCFAADPAFDPEHPTDILDGHLVTRDGRVYLRRFCHRGHGEVWSLYEEDAALWRYLQQWRVPTKIINPDTTEIFPVPMGYEHGLGPAHLQHSCIYLLDITSQCNLSCPACYANSGPEQTAYLPLESLLRSVGTAIERENGRLDVVMVSGGEPTVHPQILEMLDALAGMAVTRVLLNTNGIRIANDDAFLKRLAE